MTASKDKAVRLMSPDVDKYFGMLKDQFSSENKQGLRRSTSAGPGRTSAFRRKFDHLSNDISHKYHRHSMVEGSNLFTSITKNTDHMGSKSFDIDYSLQMGDKRFSNSYSSGDLRELMNNNDADAEDLQSRHMETALNQGKLFSVSEQNRKRRKKVFEKERKVSK